MLTVSPTTAAHEQPFKAAFDSFTYADYDAGYSVFDQTGTGTVVGDFSAESGVHFTQGYTKARGWMTITAANGDLLYVVFEQTFTAPALRTGPYLIVGGTGRFTEATGTGTISVGADSSNYPLWGTFEGTIRF